MAGTSFDEALALHQKGRVAEAEQIYRCVLQQQPDHPGALHLLGVVRQQQGDYQASLDLIGRAIAINPNKAVYRNNYGAALLSLEWFAEAEESFRRALAILPRYADAFANLAIAQAALGEEAAAEASLRQAIQIQPWHRDATVALATLMSKAGREVESRRLMETAISAAPCAVFHAVLGNLLLSTKLSDKAAREYRAAIELNPDDAITYFNLGKACEDLHDAAGTRQAFARAADLRPDHRLWRLRAEICGAIVFEDAAEIDAYCDKIGEVVEEWKNEAAARPGLSQEKIGENSRKKTSWKPIPPAGRRGLDEIEQAAAFPTMGLSFHGRDQRRLKEQFARLYEPSFRDEPRMPGSGLRDRRRVGILVTRGHERMFLLSMQAIIERLDGARFELLVLCSRSILESLRTEICRERLRFVSFGDSLCDAIDQIRAARCDLIYYWEVGTDAMNYFLPFARLAPVQATGWGSTITSGVPAVDYFLSSELVERPGSKSQYTERLWKSRTLFRYQDRLLPGTSGLRSDFGLPDYANLYVCFQNPLKLHPDFDPLLAGVLAADPKALIVLLADESGQVASLLKGRFNRHIPRADRIIFLPPQKFSVYCRLIQLADVVLDPLHYGAGSTCYDLFSYNLPVVTLPGESIIGRMTQACYRKMGVCDLIVDSPRKYVEKAVQVATDRDYRQHIVEKITKASDVLFNDMEVVREHERFFEEATDGRSCAPNS